jgi:hypothetical protein
MLAKLVPVGTPEKEWNGIPIMPGALAGNGDSAAYRFTIKATATEIQDYYVNALVHRLGWSASATGSGETGTLLLIFTNMQNTSTLSISIIPFDELFIVMLVK